MDETSTGVSFTWVLPQLTSPGWVRTKHWGLRTFFHTRVPWLKSNNTRCDTTTTLCWKLRGQKQQHTHTHTHIHPHTHTAKLLMVVKSLHGVTGWQWVGGGWVGVVFTGTLNIPQRQLTNDALTLSPPSATHSQYFCQPPPLQLSLDKVFQLQEGKLCLPLHFSASLHSLYPVFLTPRTSDCCRKII